MIIVLRHMMLNSVAISN